MFTIFSGNATLPWSGIFLAISLIFLLVTMYFAISYAISLTRSKEDDRESMDSRDRSSSMSSKTENERKQTYFNINSLLLTIFCLLCNLSVSIYFMWIIIDPIGSNEFYFFHSSNQMRIYITVSSYLSKISIFLIYHGRIYYVFQRSIYKYKITSNNFILINALVAVLSIVSLIIGYAGIFLYYNDAMQWIGFNGFRLSYIVCLCILAIMFNKRLLRLLASSAQKNSYKSVENHLDSIINRGKNDNDNSNKSTNNENSIVHNNNLGSRSVTHTTDATNQVIDNEKDKIVVTTATTVIVKLEVGGGDTNVDKRTCDEIQIVGDQDGTDKIQRKNKQTDQKTRKKKIEIDERSVFLDIVTRGSVLLTFTIITMMIICLMWLLQIYIWNNSHLGMCIALLSMSLDATVNNISVLWLFKSSDYYYFLFCKCQKIRIGSENHDENMHNSNNNNKKQSMGCHYCYKSLCLKIATKVAMKRV